MTRTIGCASRIIEVTRRQIASSSGSGRACAHDRRSVKPVYCSLPLARRVSPLMSLRIYGAAMDCVGLRLRRVGIPVGCPRALIGWICRRMRTMRAWRGNCALRSSACCPFFSCGVSYTHGAFTGRRKDLGRSEEFIEVKMPVLFTHACTRWLGNGFRVRALPTPPPLLFCDMILYRPPLLLVFYT